MSRVDNRLFLAAILIVVALIGLLLWFFFSGTDEPKYALGSQRAPRGAASPPSWQAATTTGQQAPQVSGSYCEALKVFVDALALLLKLAEYHIERLLHILDAPISMSKDLRVAAERGGFEPPTPEILTKRTSSSTS